MPAAIDRSRKGSRGRSTAPAMRPAARAMPEIAVEKARTRRSSSLWAPKGSAFMPAPATADSTSARAMGPMTVIAWRVTSKANSSTPSRPSSSLRRSAVSWAQSMP